jgi:hypothetical protein
MAYYEGMSQSEIAEALREPLGTIKTRIRSGLLKLKQSLSSGTGIDAMSHEKLSELCSIYALGRWTAKSCASLKRIWRPAAHSVDSRFRSIVRRGCDPGSACQCQAFSGFEGRLMARLDQEVPSRGVVDFKPVAAIFWIWQQNAAGSLGVRCCGRLALTVSLTRVSSLNRGLAEQQERLNQQLQQLKTLQRLLSAEKEVTQFIAKPGVRVTPLAGTDKSPQAAGQILWSAQEKKALFYASKLPSPPEGKTYQLWIIANNKPIDAGIFPVDPQGNGFLKVPLLAEADKAQKFAVTLEPAGGVIQPTGAMHLLGSL